MPSLTGNPRGVDGQRRPAAGCRPRARNPCRSVSRPQRSVVDASQGMRYALLMAARVKRPRRRGHTRVSPKHQVTLTADALTQAGLRTGDELRIEVVGPGRVMLTRTEDALDRFAGHDAGRIPGGGHPGASQRVAVTVLDAGVLVAVLDPTTPTISPRSPLCVVLAATSDTLVLPASAYAECLVVAIPRGSPGRGADMESFIDALPATVREADRSVARLAAQLRARHGPVLKLPDALVIATAVVARRGPGPDHRRRLAAARHPGRRRRRLSRGLTGARASRS